MPFIPQAQVKCRPAPRLQGDTRNSTLSSYPTKNIQPKLPTVPHERASDQVEVGKASSQFTPACPFRSSHRRCLFAILCILQLIHFWDSSKYILFTKKGAYSIQLIYSSIKWSHASRMQYSANKFRLGCVIPRYLFPSGHGGAQPSLLLLAECYGTGALRAIHATLQRWSRRRSKIRLRELCNGMALRTNLMDRLNFIFKLGITPVFSLTDRTSDRHSSASEVEKAAEQPK